MGPRIALLVGLCWAVSAVADSGWTGYGDIGEVVADASGRFSLTLKVDNNPSDCGDGTHFYAGANGPGTDKMFRVLATAVAAGKQVRLFLSGACDINGYAEFTSIGVAP